jgi:hypothetical protein
MPPAATEAAAAAAVKPLLLLLALLQLYELVVEFVHPRGRRPLGSTITLYWLQK